MIDLKTSEERKEEKRKEREMIRMSIYSRFLELSKTHRVTDAVVMTANQFNVTPQHIYVIRREFNNNK